MSNSEIEKAAQALLVGNLVAFPTETVYGLGADATNALAVAKIYKAKGRPQDHPVIVHVSNLNVFQEWVVDIPGYCKKLAQDFWPGPMTVVLKRSSLAADFITGGQETVGVRIPGNETALNILRRFEEMGGKGVAAPSANRFGKVSPTTAQAVLDELEDFLDKEDLVVDGGDCEVGLESTIIDCTGDVPRILRYGAITPSMIYESTNLQPLETESSIRVSGSLKSHYAPNVELVLNQQTRSGDGLIALEEVATPDGVIRVAAPASTVEFGQQLYAALRKADQLSIRRLVAITPDGDELSLAIADRLTRASNSSK